MRRLVVGFAVALPLVVLAAGMWDANRRLGDNRRWNFEATGYDPRDLLRGHYIQYRLALGEVDLPVAGSQDGNGCDGEDCCLCLADNGSDEPALLERTSCALALAECEGALQVRYLDQLQRYYIAEADADWMTRLFQDASGDHRALLVLAIDPAGRPRIDSLLVDGVPIEQAIRPDDEAGPDPAP